MGDHRRAGLIGFCDRLSPNSSARRATSTSPGCLASQTRQTRSRGTEPSGHGWSKHAPRRGRSSEPTKTQGNDSDGKPKESWRAAKLRNRQRTPKPRSDRGEILYQLTVNPRTKLAYGTAVKRFTDFLLQLELSLDTLLENFAEVDGKVCDFICDIWEKGKPKGWGLTLLSGLQDFHPELKGHLQRS